MSKKQISIKWHGFFNVNMAHAFANRNNAMPSREGRESVGPLLLGGAMNGLESWSPDDGSDAGSWILASMAALDKDIATVRQKVTYLERRREFIKMAVKVAAWLAILAIVLVGMCRAESQNLTASYYSRASLIQEGTAANNPKFLMANGKVFYDEGFTCACNSYPLGAVIRVINMSNNRRIIVKNTDRTAKRFKGKRIDLSPVAFRAISPSGSVKEGLIKVITEAI
jgi:hypothetical protein